MEYLRDPLCEDVIATRYPRGEYTSLAILPARLSTFRTLPGVLSPEARITPHRDTNVFITTPDGISHPLPCVDWSGCNYGYGGAGPRALAAMLTQLMHPGDADDEEFVQRSTWLSGTILEDRACPDSFTVAEAHYLFPARS